MVAVQASTSVSRAPVHLGAERIVVDQLGFLESPRWHHGELWFSDFFSRRVSSVDDSGRVASRFYVPGQPSGLAPLPNGDVLIASTHNGRLLKGGPDGSLSSVADVGAAYRGGLNDLVVDAEGRAYVSTLPDLTGIKPGDVLHCPIMLVDVDGTVRVAAPDLRVPNGMVLTAGGEILIVAETQALRLIGFPVEAGGGLGRPEVIAELGEGRKPDGIALDPTGAVWVCSPFTSEVLLVDPTTGSVDSVASTPGSWAVACAVGGADHDTLFVVTAEVTHQSMHDGRGSGAVRAYRIERP